MSGVTDWENCPPVFPLDIERESVHPKTETVLVGYRPVRRGSSAVAPVYETRQRRSARMEAWNASHYP